MSVHKGLLNPSFWRIMLVNLLVSTSVYMLLPLWPRLLNEHYSTGLQSNGWTMLMFGLGLLVPGAASSYLLDRYRRKTVCIISILVLAAVSALCGQQYTLWVMALLRLIQGAAFIMFHISLGSTILIDVTDTTRRDVTSYLYYWACRFSLALGPVICLVISYNNISKLFLWLPCVFAVVSFFLLVKLPLPFRAPHKNNFFSKDRFLLKHSYRLILVLFPASIAIGLQMALNTHLLYYTYLFLGMCLAFFFHFVVYRHADTRAEVVTGLGALLISFLLIIFNDNEEMILGSSLLSGYALGAISGRVQSFFTVISDHTERGSAQTTYKITFDMGICIGYFLGAILSAHVSILQSSSLGLGFVVLGLAFYLLCTHKWFVNHVRR